MNKIPSNAARRQAEICLALVGEIDQAVVNERQPADQILAGFYRQHREYGSRDRRFLSNAVFSWFRWRGWLKTPTNEHIAAAILLDATDLPPQLEHLLAGHELPREQIRPLGPAELEEKAGCLSHLLNIPPPQIEQLAPDWLPGLLHMQEIKAANEASGDKYHLARCIRAFQTRPPTWLRLRADQAHRLADSLTQMGIETGSHPFIEQAIFVKDRGNCDLAQLPGVEAQDLASQCVGICCNPKPEEQWWDVCAGAGGKSLHLADLMKDKGLVLATDIRPAILSQLSKRLQRKITAQSGRRPGTARPTPRPTNILTASWLMRPVQAWEPGTVIPMPAGGFSPNKSGITPMFKQICFKSPQTRSNRTAGWSIQPAP